MESIPKAFNALLDYPQFLIYKIAPRKNGKIDKIPFNWQTMRAASAHDPAIWLDGATACQIATGFGEGWGVGFTFTANDPFFFVDIDNCADAGDWNPIAKELMGTFAGAALEVSVSGRGLHIIGRGEAPPGHPCKAKAGFDIYSQERFVALTGAQAMGDAGAEHTATLCRVLGEYMAESVKVSRDEWTDAPVETYTGPSDDGALVRLAMSKGSGAAAFGGKATFADLWSGTPEPLGRSYPDDHGRPWDESRADAALASHLAFWTGKNCERIERLMKDSALAREKWDTRPDYLQDTILKAVKLQSKVFDVKPTVKMSERGETFRIAAERVDGLQFMALDQQIEHFAGCYYLSNCHRVLIPNGAMLKPEQFKALYGGYLFAMDTIADKTTKNAFEAFTESRAIRFPKVTGVKFRPLETPGAAFVDGSEIYINNYYPAPGKRVSGDVGPFLEHVAKLLPDERDREILLSYLAACVQKAGEKFQWCPVVQGVDGNGKTVLYQILEYALNEKYCFQLNATDVANKFNSWIEGKLLICVEEIRVKGRSELADALKPLITNRRVAIQAKGVDQETGDNCANFLMFSNYKDAVVKARNDRRYCCLFTAQQEVDDLARDGMGGRYFAKLYKWLNGGGYAAVCDYLSTRAIDVDVRGRAPRTTSTSEAERVSLGMAEQIILDLIDFGEPEFTGDLLDYQTCARYLDQRGKRLSPFGLSQLLNRLGYAPHPVLEASEGRVRIGGQRRRIYSKRGSLINTNIETVEDLRRYWATCKNAALSAEG
jgi:hypothetical protein